MQSLLSLNPAQRLGANGVNEVKNHPLFSDIGWDSVTTSEVAFIPQITVAGSTDYFDPRTAGLRVFNGGGQPSLLAGAIDKTGPVPYTIDALVPTSATVPVHFALNKEGISSPHDDFGTVSFGDSPALEQANGEGSLRRTKWPRSHVVWLSLGVLLQWMKTFPENVDTSDLNTSRASYDCLLFIKHYTRKRESRSAVRARSDRSGCNVSTRRGQPDYGQDH